MADLDRSEIIALLEELGADDDQQVLAAARSLSARISEEGMTWDALLRPKLTSAPDQETFVAQSCEASVSLDRADDAKLIEHLLAKKSLSRELRESLSDLKRGLSDGTADAADRRYVRALAKRLGV